MDRLKDKIALVTGSSRGIGAAIGALFAREGAKVALHGRDVDALSAVLADIVRAGGEAIDVTADVTKFSDIEAMRRRIEREFGPLDILVANAGGSFTTPGPIEETSEEEWRASIDGNLTATFLTIKSFLPRMKERRTGNIVTISSAAARRPYPMAPIAYAAAKAGIEILTQDLAGQVGPYGIRANCIAPETILTERNKTRIPSGSEKISSTCIRSSVSAHPRTSHTRRSISRPMMRRGSPALPWTSLAGRSWSERHAALSALSSANGEHVLRLAHAPQRVPTHRRQ